MNAVYPPVTFGPGLTQSWAVDDVDGAHVAQLHAEYQRFLEGHYPGRINHPDAIVNPHWLDMRKALGDDLFRRVQEWVRNLPVGERDGAWTDATSHPGAIWSVSEPLGMAIGQHLEPLVSERLGMPAYISYCGVTQHLPGVAVTPHRDVNKGSKYLISWPIALDIEPGTWPLFITGEDGETVHEYDNTHKDKALLFSGHDTWHWREGYPGRDGRLLFLRYSLCSDVRMHTSEEVAVMAEAGWRELNGEPLSLAEGIIDRQCNYLRTPSRPWYRIKGAFAPEEMEAMISEAEHHPLEKTQTEQMPYRCDTRWAEERLGNYLLDDFWRKFRECVRATAPGIFPDDVERQWSYRRMGQLTYNTYPDQTEMYWHTDSNTLAQREAQNRPEGWCTRVGRRVTAHLLLRHADRGGLLQIRGSDYDDRETEPGDVLVFRSDDLHRVTMAEKGGRVSALASYG